VFVLTLVFSLLLQVPARPAMQTPARSTTQRMAALAAEAAPGPAQQSAARPPVQTLPSSAPQAPVPLTPAPGNPVVQISTSFGDVAVELFNDKAPVSVANFLEYVADGFYTGTIFHRVVTGFVVQGGGYTPTLAEKSTRPPIQNEATNGLRNVRGTVAMARLQTLRSATSQFYFNVSSNPDLDHTGFSPRDFGYAVFGRVLSGMDVVDRIASVPTHVSGDMEDVPVTPVFITAVKVVR
jgi:cyclophilin family peptidyl-prolyl cis-trans isomerase